MFSHYVLGLAIGMAPAATWIAIRGELHLLAVVWSVGLMFYIAGFDILYSCQDADFDRESGLHSLPSRIGIGPSLWLARLSHVAALLLFVLAGMMSKSGTVFYATTFVVGMLFFIEHFLVRGGRLEKIPVAFFNVNAAISSILFFGLLIDMVV